MLLSDMEQARGPTIESVSEMISDCVVYYSALAQALIFVGLRFCERHVMPIFLDNGLGIYLMCNRYKMAVCIKFMATRWQSRGHRSVSYDQSNSFGSDNLIIRVCCMG